MCYLQATFTELLSHHVLLPSGMEMSSSLWTCVVCWTCLRILCGHLRTLTNPNPDLSPLELKTGTFYQFWFLPFFGLEFGTRTGLIKRLSRSIMQHTV